LTLVYARCTFDTATVILKYFRLSEQNQNKVSDFGHFYIWKTIAI
jgi:hypothetical protein